MDVNKAEKIENLPDAPQELFKQQRAAFHKIYKWYKSNDPFICLTGYAGTGKTTLIKYVLRDIIKESRTISAPTHKALKVLSQQVGIIGKTLHSLLGLRVNLDLTTLNIENPQFDELGEKAIRNFKYIILDEASMVNKNLFTLICRQAMVHSTRIIWVMDPLQLPPVGEDYSIVDKMINNKVNLTEIVRQEEGNALLELFPLIRKDVIEGSNEFLKYIVTHRENYDGNIGYRLLPHEEFKKEVIHTFGGDEFTNNIDYCRMAAFQNITIKQHNQFIRDNCIGHNLPAVDYDDLFTGYKTILDKFQTAIIMNSEDYCIDELLPHVSQEDISTFAVNFKSMFSGKKTEKFLIVDHTDPKSKARFIAVAEELHRRARSGDKAGWRNYYAWKNRVLILEDIYLPRAKSWVKKDIDYGYSLSVHKMQGSTFDNIAIDLTDLVNPTAASGKRFYTDPNFRNRLIYVALSRAKYSAILKY